MGRNLFLVGAGLVSTGAFAAEINLGPADFLAADQPRVVYTLTLPGTDTQVGPNFDNIGLLDTGANGLLLSVGAYDQSIANPHAPYQPALRTDLSQVIYYESGVAGTEALNVYQPYDLQYSGLTGTPVQLVSSVNVFGSPNIDLGVGAVIGMPAMQGRVVQMDPKPLTRTEIDFLQTQFYSAPPTPKTTTSYNIRLPMLPYVHSGVDPSHPDDPKPTFADLPLVDLNTTAKGSTLAQRLLLDTGAQTSIISVTAAQSMGIVLTDQADGGDILDYLTVGGIGGEALMPIVRLDRISIPTVEGDSLVLTNLEVGVLDITGIDGVLGMNFLTTGYVDHLFEGSGLYGAFSEITLDFRNPDEGTMRLDINPAYLIPEPTSLGAIGVVALLLRRGRAN